MKIKTATESTRLINNTDKKKKTINWNRAIPVLAASALVTGALIKSTGGTVTFLTLASMDSLEKVMKQIPKRSSWAIGVIASATLLTAAYLADSYNQTPMYPCTAMAAKVALNTVFGQGTKKYIMKENEPKPQIDPEEMV